MFISSKKETKLEVSTRGSLHIAWDRGEGEQRPTP